MPDVAVDTHQAKVTFTRPNNGVDFTSAKKRSRTESDESEEQPVDIHQVNGEPSASKGNGAGTTEIAGDEFESDGDDQTAKRRRLVGSSPDKPYYSSDEQWIFNEDMLLHTPTYAIMPTHTLLKEEDYRRRGCLYMDRCAAQLALCVSPTDMGFAKILFQRFFMRNALCEVDYRAAAAAALYLSTKYHNSQYRQLEDVVKVCAEQAEERHNLVNWERRITYFEVELLKSVCFDLDPEVPSETAVQLVKGHHGSHDLVEATLAYCHDALNTTLALRITARQIGHAAVYLASIGYEILAVTNDARFKELVQCRMKNLTAKKEMETG
ncbi:hypothetical protein HDV00_005297 [Rhizophlyctis rosea]|nr:hypothetical protein HDV00_005297 [Rhizophlyctis rosea]